MDQTTGTIWLLVSWNSGDDKENAIAQGTSKDTRRAYVTHSTDDGHTWAKPTEITAAVKKPEWRWYATGPVYGIQLTRGVYKARLVIPANRSTVDQNGKFTSRSPAIFSDDHGATWHWGGIEEEKPNESTVVELEDGSPLHNMRSYRNLNRGGVAWSRDGGAGWSSVKE